MSLSGQVPRRLESWKEVAAYFRRAERTVKRWEATRGLPIHRLPGAARSGVYAEIAELEAWRRSEAAALAESETGVGEVGEDEPDEADSPPAGAGRWRRPGRWAPWAVGLAAVAAVAFIASAPPFTGSRPRPRTSAAAGPASLPAQRLYLAGMDDWARRTPASLERSVGEFNAAIEGDPDYAEAYAGLAGSYDLMREYTLMPSSQAFPLAKAAAEHALALDDKVAAAHAALAFADFYGDWDAADARREFARAIALDPKSETAHHWFATFLMTQADYAGALREIDAALALDPASPAIAADRDLILYNSGQWARGAAGMKALEAAQPMFLSPHNYIAGFDYEAGDDAASLNESAIAARLTGDRTRLAMVEAARRGLRSGGHRGMLEALLAERTRQFQTGLGLAYPVAQAWVELGDRARAEAWLRLAFDRRETEATGLAADAVFAPLRADPQFKGLEARVTGS